MENVGASSIAWGRSDCNIESMLGGVPSGQTESLTARRGSPERGSPRSVTEHVTRVCITCMYFVRSTSTVDPDRRRRIAVCASAGRGGESIFLSSTRVAATPCGKRTSHRVTPDGGNRTNMNRRDASPPSARTHPSVSARTSDPSCAHPNAHTASSCMRRRNMLARSLQPC